MDAERFDTLTRSLVAASTRRRFLGDVTSVLSAGVPVALAGTATARNKRKRCNTCHGKPQGAVCLTNRECCANETRLACAFTSADGPVCCGVLGAPCGVAADCCRGFECSGGECVFLM